LSRAFSVFRKKFISPLENQKIKDLKIFCKKRNSLVFKPLSHKIRRKGNTKKWNSQNETNNHKGMSMRLSAFLRELLSHEKVTSSPPLQAELKALLQFVDSQPFQDTLPFSSNPKKITIEEELEEILRIANSPPPPPSVSPPTQAPLVDSQTLFHEKGEAFPPSSPESETPSSEKLHASNSFTERYQVLETLGEGGMGVVQRVKDTLLGREVALKTIKISGEQKQKLSKKQKMLLWRLQKEASITAILEHPHIIPLYEMQRHPSTLRQGSGQAGSGGEEELCFTMRKVEGVTLRFILKEKREERTSFYEENKLLNIFTKVGEAIAYSHAKGIIHRDLKPENIMIGTFGEVYVMDWGIAKILEKQKGALIQKLEDVEEFDSSPLDEEETTFSKHSDSVSCTQVFKTHLEKPKGEEMKTVGAVGTRGYMAPEQQECASQVTPQSDIYALGQILRECFTLLSPWEEFQKKLNSTISKSTSTTTSLKQEEIKTPEENTLVPEEILAIVQKATQEKAEDRYERVELLLKDLENYQKNLKVSVKHYTLRELMLKWIKRNPHLVHLLLLAFCLFLGFLFYTAWKNRQEVLHKTHQARALEAQAQSIQGRGKEALTLKMNTLLEALNLLNTALFIDPYHLETQEAKWEVGKTLIQLCYQSKDYQLAHFIADHMKTLTEIESAKRDQLQQEVDQEQDKTLKKHLKRFAFLKEKWYKKELSYGLGEREDALFEISKMPEKEILEELLKSLQDATAYFLKENTFEQRLQEFHFFMVMALGRLENPAAGPILLEALKTMEKATKHTAQYEYQIVLAEALANSKAFQCAEAFHQLREKRGRNSLFFKRTEVASKKLLQGQIDFYDQEIQFRPDSNSAYFQRGKAKHEKGDLEGALEDYTQSLLLNPNSAESYNNRALIRKEKGDLQGALSDMESAIRLHPQASYYNNRGFLKEKIKDLEGALLDFTEAIQRAPHETSAYNNRGLLKFQRNDLEGALKDLNTAIRLDPEYSELYLNRGNLYAKQGNATQALADYNELLRLNPQSSSGFLSRGIVKSNQGDIPEALEDYNEAIRLDPLNFQAYANRGILKEAQNDLDGAFSDFKESLRLNASPEIYFKCASLKEQKKDFTGALEDYTKAIELDPQYAKAYNNRGSIKARQKKLKEALDDYTSALRLNPSSLTTYLNRASAYNETGQRSLALADLSKAIELDPKHPLAYLTRGGIKFIEKDLDGAIQDLLQGLNLQNPSQYPTFATFLTDLLAQRILQKYRKGEWKRSSRISPFLKILALLAILHKKKWYSKSKGKPKPKERNKRTLRLL
jgi:serine/threonine protein kinase/tetratricopeptide (TPR) repeat protein